MSHAKLTCKLFRSGPVRQSLLNLLKKRANKQYYRKIEVDKLNTIVKNILVHNSSKKMSHNNCQKKNTDHLF